MPEPSPYQTPERLRQQLRLLFTLRAVGRENAVTMRRMLRMDALWPHSGREIREAIAELVKLDRLPIAGDAGRGYYRVQTEGEKRKQVRELANRVRALAKRMRIFGRAAECELGGQRTFDGLDAGYEADVELAERILEACGEDDE